MNTRKLLVFLVSCIIIIPALPPVFVPLFEPYTFGKTEIFEMLVEIAGIVWCISIWQQRRDVLSRIRKSFLAKAVVFLLGAFLISTFTSSDIGASFWGSSARNDGFFTLIHYFVLFFILTETVKRNEWLYYFRLSLFSSFFVSCYSLFQYFNFPFVRSSEGAIFGTLGNASYLATYLLFHIFLAFLIARKETSVNIIPLWHALALFEIAILYMTGSRAGMLGLVFGFLIYVGALFYYKIKKPLLPLCIFVISLLCIVAFNIHTIKIENIINDQTLQSRLVAWHVALSSFPESPLWGHGANQYQQAYISYISASSYNTPTNELFDKPHNILFEILFSYGIFGLLAYGALWFFLFQKIKKTQMGLDAFLWFGMFSAYGIMLLFLFDTFSSLLLFFLFLAYFASYEIQHEHIIPNITVINIVTIFVLCGLFFSVFHFKPLYSAYWARLFLVKAESTRILDNHMKTEATRYTSFNSDFINNAILFTEQNLKKVIY